MVNPERQIVIRSQRSSSHGQQLITQEPRDLVPELCFDQRAGKIATGHNGVFVRDATQSHVPSVAIALEDKRLVVPFKVCEAVREISLSGEDNFFAARPMAPAHGQTGLEHRKRFCAAFI